MSKLHILPTGASGRVGAGWQHSGLSLLYCLLFSLIPAAALVSPASAAPAREPQCPDLQAYYPGQSADWLQLSRDLQPLMEQCLWSAEYFALYGAAQLNSGDVDGAAKSLERALLLDPEASGARVDYAEALLRLGQIFPALELNGQLLDRDDLPTGMDEMLAARQDRWRDMTRRGGVDIDLLAGYDSNLNRGPSANEITLTLSGEPVDLVLSPEFRPVRGAYGNLRLSGYHTRLRPEGSDNFIGEVFTRASEDSDSDIAQFNAQYMREASSRTHSWRTGAGISHLMAGGHPLFTAMEASTVYRPESDAACSPRFRGALQYQYYHERGSHLDAVEVKPTAVITCRRGRGELRMELSPLASVAVDGDRPGGDRVGWQTTLGWQYALPVGAINLQLSHTRLSDDEGYSELLAGGARRHLSRSFGRLQYRYPLPGDSMLLFNVYHQHQRSNIELFTSRDSAAEIGVRLSF